MRRAALVALVVVGCAACAAGGFWFGFREGWWVGTQAAYLPRGALAAQNLAALRAGKTHGVFIGLEFEVDSGLVWADALFRNPMRSLWQPVWGLGIFPDYERYATRMADYRRQHASFLKPESFGAAADSQPQNPEIYQQLSREARESRETIQRMIERYATRGNPP